MSAGELILSVVAAMLAAGLMLALMPGICRALRLERPNFAGETVGTGYGVVDLAAGRDGAGVVHNTGPAGSRAGSHGAGRLRAGRAGG